MERKGIAMIFIVCVVFILVYETTTSLQLSSPDYSNLWKISKKEITFVSTRCVSSTLELCNCEISEFRNIHIFQRRKVVRNTVVMATSYASVLWV